MSRQHNHHAGRTRKTTPQPTIDTPNQSKTPQHVKRWNADWNREFGAYSATVNRWHRRAQ